MKQGTTPTILLTVKNRDLSNKSVYVTFRYNGKQFTKTNDDMNITYVNPNTILAVMLSQKETLAFAPGTISVDVRWVDENGNAEGTNLATLQVTESLLKMVITYD